MKEKWPAIVGLVIGVPASGVAFYAECAAERPSFWKLIALGLAALSVLGLGILKLLQSSYKDAKDDAKDSPEDLKGCLHVIHRIVAGYKRVENPPDGWLRITVHRVDRGKRSLEQSVDYVGSSDGGAGREFPIHAGLIGKVARERPIKPRLFERPEDMGHDEWIDHLVRELAMTREDAQKTRPGRFSFLGVPIPNPDNDEVRAVVYLDAAEPGFFTKKAIALVVNGCEGLATWTDEHYYGN